MSRPSICVDCGSPTSDGRYVRCLSCRSAARTRQRLSSVCVDCGSMIRRENIRCRACHAALATARIEDIEWLLDAGATPTEIALRTGHSLMSTARFLERHGRHDLARPFSRQERRLRPMPRRRKPRQLTPCGTPAAYLRHLRRGEPTCPQCRQSWAERSRQARQMRRSA